VEHDVRKAPPADVKKGECSRGKGRKPTPPPAPVEFRERKTDSGSLKRVVALPRGGRPKAAETAETQPRARRAPKAETP